MAKLLTDRGDQFSFNSARPLVDQSGRKNSSSDLALRFLFIPGFGGNRFDFVFLALDGGGGLFRLIDGFVYCVGLGAASLK